MTASKYTQVNATAGGVAIMVLAPSVGADTPYNPNRPTPVIIFARENVVVTTTGPHGDDSNFPPVVDYNSFLQRCFDNPAGLGWLRK